MKTETFLFLIILLFFIALGYSSYKHIEKDSINKANIQNATLLGYQQALIDSNNQYIDDLLKFGYTYQIVYYQNQSFNMKCEVVKQ